MAFINYLCLAVMAAAFSMVENAPSNIDNKSPRDQLQLRLIFVNRNDDNIISGNAPAISYNRQTSILPTLQKSRLAKIEKITESVFAALNAESRPTKAPGMDDERQNWGLIIEDRTISEDESLYNRPLSLPKVVNTQYVNDRKQAKVASKTTVTTTSAPIKPSDCDTAVITCCINPIKLKECFESVGCPNATEDMLSHLCSDSYIKQVIHDFAKYYKRD